MSDTIYNESIQLRRIWTAFQRFNNGIQYSLPRLEFYNNICDGI